MRPLYKTTIVIWSDYNPIDKMELEDLAREATSGDAYCSKMTAERVEDPEGNPDWDRTEFFQEDEDEDEGKA